MKRVQASIEDLAHEAPDTFCTGVEHLWFCAWQYAEGNLWASLLHHIFASLHPDRSHYELAVSELMVKVESARRMKSVAEEQVEAAQSQLHDSTTAIDDAKERHQKAVEESRRLRMKDLWDLVSIEKEDQGLKAEVVKAVDDLGLSAATETARDLDGASRQVIDVASRVRAMPLSLS
jgi:hypothetical protein